MGQKEETVEVYLMRSAWVGGDITFVHKDVARELGISPTILPGAMKEAYIKAQAEYDGLNDELNSYLEKTGQLCKIWEEKPVPRLNAEG